MKIIALLISAVLLTRCGSDEPPRQEPGTVRTIQQEHLPRPHVDDELSPGVASGNEQPVTLPYRPPISMDPVDGSKVTIRRDTPTLEHDGKIYHFSSPENLERFRENPKKYLSGSLATY
jgi:YHS domain-containing protein